MLTHIAERLGVASGTVEDLYVGVDDLERVLRLVPQMQEFITRVTLQVWGDEDHLLSETIERLERKRHELPSSSDREVFIFN
jgi:DNA-directed RNA polymerase specialized sigma24 family protein